METITGTTQRFTEDDLACMLVEFEKYVNLYIDLASKCIDLMGEETDSADERVDHLRMDHMSKLDDRIIDLGALIQSIAHAYQTDGAESWCVGDGTKDKWDMLHTRYVEQMHRLDDIRKLLVKKLMDALADKATALKTRNLSNGEEQ